MKIRVPKDVGKLLSSGTTGSFSRKASTKLVTTTTITTATTAAAAAAAAD
jgi:hypothetical protein